MMIKCKDVLCVLLAMVCALSLASAADASAFRNGSFETGPDPGTTFITLYAGNTQIDGWVVSSGNIDYANTANLKTSNGQRCIDLNGNRSAGGIRQTFDTVAGRQYRVLFDLAGNPVGSPVVKTMRVTAGSDSADFTFDTTGRSEQNMGWVAKTFTFTASSSATTLTFRSTQSDGSYGPVIDHIRVVPVVKQGRIVASNDDWTLSDTGFSEPNDACTFAKNIAAWFTAGVPGSFLAYSTHFGLSGTELANCMTSAGHTWTVDATIPFTLANLQKYDGVFLGVTQADNQLLIDYVNRGGNVYVFSGDSWCAALWNTFLEHFGLKFVKTLNGVGGSIPISSPHPLFAAVDHLYNDIGTPILDLDPVDPRNKILVTYSGKPLYAVYDPHYTPDAHGCVSLAGTPVRNRQVILSQTGEPDQTTRTDANGCYDFDTAVSGKTFEVLIKGPVVP